MNMKIIYNKEKPIEQLTFADLVLGDVFLDHLGDLAIRMESSDLKVNACVLTQKPQTGPGYFAFCYGLNEKVTLLPKAELHLNR